MTKWTLELVIDTTTVDDLHKTIKYLNRKGSPIKVSLWRFYLTPPEDLKTEEWHASKYAGLAIWTGDPKDIPEGWVVISLKQFERSSGISEQTTTRVRKDT